MPVVTPPPRLIERETSYKRRTVRIIFEVLSPTNPISYTRLGVRDAVKHTCGFSDEDIDIIGFLRRSNEFEVVLATKELCDKVAEHQFIKLADDRKGKVTALTPNQFDIRILWLPAYVSEEVIAETLLRNAPGLKINRIDFEVDREGFRNNNRIVNVTCADRESIPLTMMFPTFTDKRAIEGLVSVPGKEKECLRCHQKGHWRRDCNLRRDDVSWCITCRKNAGHCTDNHLNSWADRASRIINGTEGSSEVPADVIDTNSEQQGAFTFRKSVDSVMNNAPLKVPQSKPAAPLSTPTAPASKQTAPPSHPGAPPPPKPEASVPKPAPTSSNEAESTSSETRKTGPDDILQASGQRTDGSDDLTQGDETSGENTQSQSLLPPNRAVKRKGSYASTSEDSCEFDSNNTSAEDTPEPNQEAEKRKSRERRRRKYNEMSQDGQGDFNSSMHTWKSTAEDRPVENMDESFDPITGQREWGHTPVPSRSPSPSRVRSRSRSPDLD